MKHIHTLVFIGGNRRGMLRGCHYALLSCGSGAAAGLTRCFSPLAWLSQESAWCGRLLDGGVGGPWSSACLCALPLCAVSPHRPHFVSEEWFLVQKIVHYNFATCASCSAAVGTSCWPSPRQSCCAGGQTSQLHTPHNGCPLH